MNLMSMFFNKEISSYNITMVLVYLIFVTAAFAVCVLISHMLKIYHPKTSEIYPNTINAES